MDQSLYISYTVLLDKHILAQIGTHYIFLLHILYTHHVYAYQVFGAVVGEIVVFYANINTKYFFGTSDFFFLSKLLFFLFPFSLFSLVFFTFHFLFFVL